MVTILAKGTDFREQLKACWLSMCSTHQLTKGTKKREQAALQFTQGILFSATFAGIMSQDEAQKVYFLAQVGRLQQWLEGDL